MDSTQSNAREARNRLGATLHRLRRASVSRFPVALPLLVVLVAVAVILAPVWRSGYPWGSDAWGHLQRADYMGQTLRQYGVWDGLVRSAWMTDWYMGDPMRVYYPPLTVWSLGLLTAGVGDALLAYRLLVTLIFAGLGYSVYAIGVRWGRDRWLAAAGAVIAVAAPYTVRTVFVEGNLPRGLALLPLPWVFWYTERVLTEKRVAGVWAVLAALWTVMILAHVMQAVMFAFAVALYVVVRLLDNVYVPLRRGVLALIPVGLGGGIAAAYLLPAYSHAELSNVPYLPAAKIAIFSIAPEALSPTMPSSIEAIRVGIALAVVAVLLTLRTSAPQHKALLAVGAACVLLAFGPDSGVFRLLPLHSQLLPERFLNVSAIAFPLIVATTPLGTWSRRWMVLVVAVVLLVDGRPALRAVFMRPAPPDEVAIAEVLDGEPLPGRVANLTFPNPNASQLYLNSVIGGHANVSGWALENTPHHPAVRRLLTSVHQSLGYMERMLALWNADYIVSRFDDPTVAPRVEAELGFSPVATEGDLTLWERAAPSAFVQTLPDDRMLIIGDNPTDWLFAFPFASEGESADPAAYDADYLAHFSVIGLTRLAENPAVESALGDWVREGHTLIVDLSGLGQTYQEGYSLFGVHAIPLALSGSYPVSWPSGLDALPGTLAFSEPGETWVGATYIGLEPVVALTHDGTRYPLLGRQSVGAGQVWFVGFNLIYFLEQSDQFTAVDQLVDYLVAGTDVARDLTLPALDVQVTRRDAAHVTFDYTLDAPASVVVSMTYFPRWQAAVDGHSIPLASHEHLVLLDLPAGTHTVTLHYAPFSTVVSWLGWVVSGLVLLLTGVLADVLRRRPVLATADRAEAFSDRLPSNDWTPSTQYTSCPNCQFQLATSGPPNELSYPFDTLDCPICGFSLGKSDVVPNAVLSEPEKRALVHDWMRRTGLTEERLMQQFGLTSRDLFTPRSLESDPASDVAARTLHQLESLAAAESSSPPAAATGPAAAPPVTALAPGTSQPESQAAPQPAYSACPNCGFRLAYVRFPQDRLLPQQVSECPICGFSPNRSRFMPSTTLSPATKRLLGEAWVQRAGLTEGDLLERFNLTVDDLFEPGHDPGP